MMIPVAITGYYFHAGNVAQNILEQVCPTSLWSIAANVLITSHLLFAFVIIQNPIAQKIEKPWEIEVFGLKRAIIRTGVSVFSKKKFFAVMLWGRKITCVNLIFFDFEVLYSN